MADKTLVDGPSDEPGIYLFLSVTPDAIVMHHAARIDRAARDRLRPPMLPSGDADSEPISELVLDIIDFDGTVRDSFAWPADCEVFVETVDPRTGDLISRPSQLESWWGARFRVPATDSTRYLRFFRRDTPGDYHPLSLFDLDPGGPVIPLPFPVPWPGPPTPLPLPAPPLQPSLVPPDASGPPSVRHASREDRIASGGHIVGARRLLDSGDPAQCFDIVILGDGFRENELGFGLELGTFDMYANAMAQAFLRTPPYSRFANRINIHAVYVASTQSGITDCPAAGAARNTYFKTRGFWNSTLERPTAATYIGIPEQHRPRVAEAVRTAIPDEHANLIMMIVNCPSEGGSAPPEMGLAFVTLAPEIVKFAQIAMHESGHVVANLCEEYNPCNRRQRNRIYPNETTAENVANDTVPWKFLAKATELDASGKLKALHHHGDAVDANCQPVMGAGLYPMLGAFWGCHNGDGDNDASGAARYCHRCGSGFYRPMAECKMRRLKYPFCRVCEHLIARAILVAAPNPLSASVPSPMLAPAP